MKNKSILKNARLLMSTDGSKQLFVDPGDCNLIPIDRQFQDTREEHRLTFAFDGNTDGKEVYSATFEDEGFVSKLSFIKVGDWVGGSIRDVVTIIDKLAAFSAEDGYVTEFTKADIEERHLMSLEKSNDVEYLNVNGFVLIFPEAAHFDVEGIGTLDLDPGVYISALSYAIDDEELSVMYTTYLDITFVTGQIDKIPYKYLVPSNYNAGENDEGYIENRPFYLTNTNDEVLFQGVVPFCDTGIDFNLLTDKTKQELTAAMLRLEHNVTYECLVDNKIYHVKIRDVVYNTSDGGKSTYVHFGHYALTPFEMLISPSMGHVQSNNFVMDERLSGEYEFIIKGPSVKISTEIPYWSTAYKCPREDWHGSAIFDYADLFKELLDAHIRVLFCSPSYMNNSLPWLELVRIDRIDVENRYYDYLARSLDGLTYRRFWQDEYNHTMSDRYSVALAGNSSSINPIKRLEVQSSESDKMFAITVSDAGVITATEITR